MGEKKKKKNLDPHLISHTKNNLKWIIGLNKNAQTVIEIHMRKSFQPWNRIDKDFLGHKNHDNNQKS